MPATQSQDLDDRIPDTAGITSAAFAITQQPPLTRLEAATLRPSLADAF
jgi:hypothetical protein